MDCPANCPIYKRNMELEEKLIAREKQHQDELGIIRQMLKDKKNEKDT